MRVLIRLGLMINDCDENDNGEYTITIDNLKSSKAQVIVEPEQEKIRSPSPNVQAEQKPAEEDAKPGFRKLLPKQLNINEDEDLVLECEVNNPKQITDWYLDDDLIGNNTPRCQIINDGPIRKLKGLIHQFFSFRNRNVLQFLVNKVNLNDTGKYTCKDRQTGQTTDCEVTVSKAPIRIIKGLPETLIVPQGKNGFIIVFVDIHQVESMEEQ